MEEKLSKDSFDVGLAGHKINNRGPGFYTYPNSVLTVIASKCYGPYRVFSQQSGPPGAALGLSQARWIPLRIQGLLVPSLSKASQQL